MTTEILIIFMILMIIDILLIFKPKIPLLNILVSLINGIFILTNYSSINIILVLVLTIFAICVSLIGIIEAIE